MNARDLLLAGEMNLRDFMKSMRLKEEEENQSKQDGYGAR